MATSSALISVAELRDNLAAFKVVDASWHMPSAGRNARAEYESEHIAGAVFFDLDKTSDVTSALPHMLPSPELFAAAMGELGISTESYVVVYDAQGLFSAARLWWMLRVFGHEKVRVLDGGLPRWKAIGAQLESGVPNPAPAVFVPHFRPELVASMHDVAIWADTNACQIADARSPARFAGHEPEPRAGVRSGHIPGAKNLHYARLLADDGTLLPPSQLQHVLADVGINASKPLVASCGSGVTACIIALAMHELGYADVPVYDGSWAEWGASSLPVATGA